MKALKLALFVLIIILFNSCLSNDDLEKDDERAIRKYIAENGLEATRDDSRLYFIPISKNPSGPKLVSGNVVEIFFSISVMGGAELDKQDESDGQPLKIQYYTSTVSPAAVDIALSLMRAGETFRFLVPSSLGFGKYGAGALPQNSILDLVLTVVNSYSEEEEITFEHQAIEDSLSVNNMTEFVYYPDLGIYYKEIVPGTGPDIIDGDQLNISYVGKYFGGEQFDSSSSFVFTAGGALVIKGLGDGVKLMKKGGRGVLILPSGKAYGGSTIVIPRQLNNNIFPYSILEFDITIL